MNLFTGIGRITNDIELKQTQSGTNIATFTLAINRDKQNADFLNCIAFNKTAELLAQYTKKGNLLAVNGKVQTRNYEGKDGKKVYVTEIIVNQIEFLEKKQAEFIEVDNLPF
jgi:single-strand DNA-binding protein